MLLKILLGVSVGLNIIGGMYLINIQRTTTRVARTIYTVERVLDGDTFDLDNKQRIRLASVDAPEMGLCGSQESKDYLKNLIEGKEVTIKAIRNEDGRTIALAYMGEKLINDELLKAGWAEYLSPNSGVNEILKKSGEEAREKKIGIFSELCRQTTPPDPKCVIKGNIKDGHKIYFYPGCGNYSNVLLELNHGDQWLCNEAEAKKAGFVKSKNCH